MPKQGFMQMRGKKKKKASFPLIRYRLIVCELFSQHAVYRVFFCVNFGKPNCTIKKAF